jgi:branched-chain amino acid transport system permease protein
MTFDTALQALANGLALGFTYTAVALGLSLTLGVLGIVNMAHSALLIAAALLTWQFVNVFGLHPLVAMVIVVPGFFLIGAALYLVLLRPVSRQPEATGLLLLFGLLIMVESLALATWTTDPRTMRLGEFGQAITVGPVTVTLNRLAAAVMGGLGALGLFLFLQYTMAGRATRAMADNRDAASVMGIDTNRLSTVVFGIGIALAGLAGVALAVAFTFSPQEHVRWLAWAFLIVIIGGLGSVQATVFAGLVVGVTESFVGLLLPFQYTHFVIYAMLAVGLVVRGGGLIAAATRRL